MAVGYDANAEAEVDWVTVGYEVVYITGYSDDIEPPGSGVTDIEFDVSDSSTEGVNE